MKQFKREFSKMDGVDSPDWVTRLRREAFEHFDVRGFPDRHHEDWKYTSLKAIDQTDYRLPDEPSVTETARESDAQNCLVFLNGIYRPELSTLPGDVIVAPLNKVWDDASIDLKKRLNAETLNGNPFTALNRAFLENGVCVTVPKGVVLDDPIYFDYRFVGNQPLACFPANYVIAEKGSHISVIEQFHEETANHLVSQAIDFTVSENAHVDHAQVVLGGDGNSHIAHITAKVQRDGTFASCVYAQHGRLVRNNISVKLTEPGGNAALSGIYLAANSDHIDNHVAIDHVSANCQSSQLFKGVLDGTSRAVFNGKVVVRQDAQGTLASQLNKSLLLSPTAEVDTKPVLNIDADDVKCSHGATVGPLNPLELFYLESRGISPDRAKQALAKAFVGDVTYALACPHIMSRMQGLVGSYFS